MTMSELVGPHVPTPRMLCPWGGFDEKQPAALAAMRKLYAEGRSGRDRVRGGIASGRSLAAAAEVGTAAMSGGALASEHPSDASVVMHSASSRRPLAPLLRPDSAASMESSGMLTSTLSARSQTTDLPSPAEPDAPWTPIPLHDSPVTFIASLAGDVPRLLTVDAQQRVGVHAWVVGGGAASSGPELLGPEPDALALDTRLPNAHHFVKQASPAFREAPWSSRVDETDGPANRGEPVGEALAPALIADLGISRFERLAGIPTTAALSAASPSLMPWMVAVSSDGTHAAVGGQWDNAVRIVSLAGGCPVTAVVRGQLDVVTSVAIVAMPSPAAEVGAVGAIESGPHGFTGAHKFTVVGISTSSLRAEAGLASSSAAAEGAVTGGGIMAPGPLNASMTALCAMLDRVDGAQLVSETAILSTRPGVASVLTAVAANAAEGGRSMGPAVQAALARAISNSDDALRSPRSSAAGGPALSGTSSGSSGTPMLVSNLPSGLGLGMTRHFDLAAAKARRPDSSAAGIGSSPLDVTRSMTSVDLLVVGSADAAVRVWVLHGGRVSARPLLLLHGHDRPVTCVAANAALDALVSSSLDGTVIVRTLRDGRYCRSIVPPMDRPGRIGRGGGMSTPRSAAADASDERERLVPLPPIHWVGLSNAGIIVTFSRTDRLLRSYSLDGRPMCTRPFRMKRPELRAAVFSEDGRWLFAASSQPRIIVVLNAETMEHVWSIGFGAAPIPLTDPDHSLRKHDGEPGQDTAATAAPASVSTSAHVVAPFPQPITALAFSRGERHLIVGLEDGRIVLFRHDIRNPSPHVTMRAAGYFSY